MSLKYEPASEPLHISVKALRYTLLCCILQHLTECRQGLSVFVQPETSQVLSNFRWRICFLERRIRSCTPLTQNP